jgi:hypothetical protein
MCVEGGSIGRNLRRRGMFPLTAIAPKVEPW